MRIATALGAALLGSALAIPALAEEEHRELSAHEHGHGTLNIAIEGNTIAMELITPGADIVGFEHEAKTKKQKSAMEDGRNKLKAALTLFKFPSGADCIVDNADVKLKTESGGSDKDKDHDHAHHDHEHDDHGHDESASSGSAHSEFHASYELTCEAPDKITSIFFGYFDAFAQAKELDVNVVTAKGQSTFEATRDKPQIELGGLT